MVTVTGRNGMGNAGVAGLPFTPVGHVRPPPVAKSKIILPMGTDVAELLMDPF
jgi:hypothetical protein